MMHILWMTMLVVTASVSVASGKIQSETKLYGQLLEEAGKVTKENEGKLRVSLVHAFSNNLKQLDDKGLGDSRLFMDKQDVAKREQAQQQLDLFSKELGQIVDEYHQNIKPILLNNLKYKRQDKAAVQNYADLVKLFFVTKDNHYTGKPVTGLLFYKQDISDSIFSEKIVDAGMELNFPELKEAAWLTVALQMEAELNALRKLHQNDYELANKIAEQPSQPNVKPVQVKKENKHESLISAHITPFKRVSTDVAQAHITQEISKSTKVITAAVREEELPIGQRITRVQKFTRALRKLNVEQSLPLLEAEVNALVKTYRETIQPILIKNVSLKRQDAGARANKGDLFALFFRHRSNHYTGKPISGKLRYQKDVSNSLFSKKIMEVGLLVEQPNLADKLFIQDALNMEAELVVLLDKHRDYIKD